MSDVITRPILRLKSTPGEDSPPPAAQAVAPTSPPPPPFHIRYRSVIRMMFSESIAGTPLGQMMAQAGGPLPLTETIAREYRLYLKTKQNLPTKVAVRIVHGHLKRHTQRIDYLKACVLGAPRYNLDGQAVSVVNPHQADWAAGQLAAKMAPRPPAAATPA